MSKRLESLGEKVEELGKKAFPPPPSADETLKIRSSTHHSGQLGVSQGQLKFQDPTHKTFLEQ